MLSLFVTNDTLRDYLPVIVSLAVAVLTFISGIYLGTVKNRTDKQSNKSKADEAIRDDLLELVNHYEAQLKNKDDVIEKLTLENNTKQTTIFQLMTDKTKTEIDNLKLLADNTYLKSELTKIENKVFYIREEKDDTKSE